jgi:hypothetical protein
MAEEIEVVRAAVVAQGEVVGVVHVHPEHWMPVAGALATQGYGLQSAERQADGTIVAGETCTPEDKRPCEVNITAQHIADLARDAGGNPAAIDQLEQKRVFSEAEALAAIDQTIATIPDPEVREEAELWRAVAFGETEAGGG